MGILFFGIDWLNIGRDPSTSTVSPSPLRMTNWDDFPSTGINHNSSLKTSRVEALAEIFDFVAGLVQRVPKKPNEMKADLLNSTARLRENNLV